MKPVVPKAKTTYALVTVYEDFDGNAEIYEIADCGVKALKKIPNSIKVTKKIAGLLVKATSEIDGVGYHAVTYLGNKKVKKGRDYYLLCDVTVVCPGAQPKLRMVTLRKDKKGKVTLRRVAEFKTGE